MSASDEHDGELFAVRTHDHALVITHCLLIPLRRFCSKNTDDDAKEEDYAFVTVPNAGTAFAKGKQTEVIDE